MSQPLNSDCISHTGTTGGRGGWLSSGGIKSGLKPTPGPLAPKLRPHTHICLWVSVFMWEERARKGQDQPTSSPPSEGGEKNRGELGVGCGWVTVWTVWHCPHPVLKLCSTWCQWVFNFHRLMRINWHLTFFFEHNKKIFVLPLFSLNRIEIVF